MYGRTFEFEHFLFCWSELSEEPSSKDRIDEEVFEWS